MNTPSSAMQKEPLSFGDIGNIVTILGSKLHVTQEKASPTFVPKNMFFFFWPCPETLSDQTSQSTPLVDQTLDFVADRCCIPSKTEALPADKK